MSKTDNFFAKKERGCSFIALLVVSCFIVAGIIFFLSAKIFGEENRHLVFFGILGVAITIFLGREIIKK